MEINKIAIVKGYNKILKWLLLASTIITIIYMLVPLFHLNILGIKQSEMGIKFVWYDLEPDEKEVSENMLGTEKKDQSATKKDSTLFNLHDVDSFFLDDLTFEETFAWKMGLRILGFCMLIFALAGLIEFLPKTQKTKNAINENNYLLEKSRVYSGLPSTQFWTCTLYVVLAEFLCLFLFNDWQFRGVKTLTVIPWIFHLAVFIACKVIIQHRDRALKGEVVPLCSVSSNIPGGHTAAASQQGNAPTTQNTEKDKVELLIKYKELFDQGVITEEEYNQKKKELL